MKKIIFLLFILLLPLAFADYNISIFKGWANVSNPLVTKNGTFMFDYSIADKTTYIIFPEGYSAYIFNGENNCTKEGVYSICQKEISFKRNGYEVPPFPNREYNISLKLEINKTVAGISIIKDVFPETIFVGDKVEIKTTLNKLGPLEITNITFEDSFPDSFTLEKGVLCSLQLNKFVWEGYLNKSSTYCTYNVYPKKPGVFPSSISLEYYVAGKELSQKINKTLNVSLPYRMNISLSNKTLKLNESLFITINFTAMTNIDIKELKISAPAAFAVLNTSPGFRQLSYSESMKTGENFSLNAEIVSREEDSFIIKVPVSYYYKGVLWTQENSFNISYLGEELKIEIFKRDNKSLLRVSNPKITSFSNIELNVSGNRVNISYLKARTYMEFDLPLFNQKEIPVHLTYDTEFGQEMEKEISLSFIDSAKEVTTPVVEEKKPFDIAALFDLSNFNMLYVFVPLGVIVLIFIIIGIAGSIKSKSSLDREIEEIKKQLK